MKRHIKFLLLLLTLSLVFTPTWAAAAEKWVAKDPNGSNLRTNDAANDLMPINTPALKDQFVLAKGQGAGGSDSGNGGASSGVNGDSVANNSSGKSGFGDGNRPGPFKHQQQHRHQHQYQQKQQQQYWQYHHQYQYQWKHQNGIDR